MKSPLLHSCLKLSASAPLPMISVEGAALAYFTRDKKRKLSFCYFGRVLHPNATFLGKSSGYVIKRVRSRDPKGITRCRFATAKKNVNLLCIHFQLHCYSRKQHKHQASLRLPSWLENRRSLHLLADLLVWMSFNDVTTNPGAHYSNVR